MNDKTSPRLLLPTLETPTLTKAELSELLFERLDHPDMAPRKVMLSGRQIERGSVGARRVA